jgi:sn-glycerol 3-phosphate transport system substrate-binding protein
MKLGRRNWVAGIALAAATMFSSASALAQELQFYYPIAVGGPITKLIDGYAADFEKENPGIRIKPVYSGSYQDTITKTLTALKGGEPPHLAILLSTDMFTLIDEDAIVPFDDIRQGRGQGLARELLPRLHGEQPDRRQDLGHPLPALHHRALLEQGAVQGGRPRSREGAGELGRAGRNGAEAHEEGRRRQRHAMGRADPELRLPLLAVPGFTTQNDVRLMNPEGNAPSGPGVVEALQFWVDLGRKHQVHGARHRRVGHHAADFFERKVAMMWTTTGNLTNVRNNAKFPFGVAMLPANKRRGSPTGGGNFYVFKKATPAQREAALKFAQVGDAARARRAVGHRHRLRRGVAGRLRDAAHEEYVAGFPAAAVARDQLPHACGRASRPTRTSAW